MVKQTISWLFLCLFFAPADTKASADTNLFQMSLSELVAVEINTASGFEQTLSQSPASVIVYYPWQWQAMGIERLDELLETIPGFHVTQSQLALNMDIYGVRGLQSGFNDKIDLLIDGQTIKGGNGGSTAFGFKKSLAGIKRIEIIKGPGSVVYGADAVSGAINLITMKSDSLENPQVNVRAGGFDSVSFDVTNSIDLELGHLDFALSYMHNNNDNERKIDTDLQVTIDQIFSTNVSKAPSTLSIHNEILDILVNYSVNDFSLTLWRWQSEDAGVGTGAAQILDPAGYTDTIYHLISGQQTFRRVLGGELNLNIAFQQYDGKSNYTIFPAGSVLPIGEDGNVDFATPVGLTLFSDGYLGKPGSKANIWRADLNHTAKLNPKMTLRSEIGFESQEVTTSEYKNFGPGILDGSESVVTGQLTNVTGTDLIYRKNTSREIGYLSVQAQWLWTDNWSLNIGARYDDYSDIGDTFNPRGAIIWTDNANWTTKLIYGTAFSAPSASELFFKNNPSATGNPNLTEEDIVNTDLIVEWRPTHNWSVSLDLFKYDADDLIEFVFDSSRGEQIAQNIGGQQGKGGEFQVTAQLNPNLRLSAYYAWVAIDFDNASNSIDYPRKQSYVSLDWRFSSQWSVHGRYKHIADRKRGAADPRPDLEDYSVANVKFSFHGLADNTSLALIINNAFNDKGLEPSPVAIPDGYPIASRQFVAEMQYQF